MRRIVDLRPGVYSVTFTLPGFNTVKREGNAFSGTMFAAVATSGMQGNNFTQDLKDRGLTTRRKRTFARSFRSPVESSPTGPLPRPTACCSKRARPTTTASASAIHRPACIRR